MVADVNLEQEGVGICITKSFFLGLCDAIESANP